MILVRRRRACLWLGALACAWTSVLAAAPAQVDIIELRQTPQSLRETYAKGKRMGIPRMVMLDGRGQLIYGDGGLRDDLVRRMHEAYRKDRPINAAISLAAVLDETETTDGKRLTPEALPAADLYVVDYWAQWCEPCRLMSRIIDGALKHWDGVHSVWLKVESDPEKVDKESAS